MSFEEADFALLGEAYPDLEIVRHRRPAALKEALAEAELVDSWFFPAGWYEEAPRLRAVFTPAAGRDWVESDPGGRVAVHHGTFHGPLVAESMLGMMLHFNRKIPEIVENQRRRRWDRNLQFPGSLLRSQRAIILGYGAIGRHCARLLGVVGMSVVGCQRKIAGGIDEETGARYCRPEDLPQALPQADHIVLLLPGGEETRGFLSRDRLAHVKRGAHVYNFGRGTTSPEADLRWALDEGLLAGAGLDVTEVEPLAPESSLWADPRVLITPHSSCVYDEYRPWHVAELVGQLRPYL